MANVTEVLEQLGGKVQDLYVQVRAYPALLEVAKTLNLDIDLTLGIALLLALLLFLLSYLVLRLSFGSSKSDTILLLGLCGAGKTSLYYQLRDGSIHGGTVTSMDVNEGSFPLHSELSESAKKVRPVHIVDVPGHPRLRSSLDSFLPQARGVVFVVDALDFMPHIKENAEFLFSILTRPEVVRRRVPVLLACNKMDKITAHSLDFVRKQLEKELDKLRLSRPTTSSADDDSATATIGVPNEPFKFAHCTNRITTVECSASTGKVGDIEAFIRELVRA